MDFSGRALKLNSLWQMPKKSTYVYLSSQQRSWRSPKTALFHKEQINCWGLPKKRFLLVICISAQAKKANCYFLASLLANAQELISLLLLRVLLLNE